MRVQAECLKSSYGEIAHKKWFMTALPINRFNLLTILFILTALFIKSLSNPSYDAM